MKMEKRHRRLSGLEQACPDRGAEICEGGHGDLRTAGCQKILAGFPVDTEKLIAQEYPVRENALAEEIECKEPYVKSFIQFYWEM